MVSTAERGGPGKERLGFKRGGGGTGGERGIQVKEGGREERREEGDHVIFIPWHLSVGGTVDSEPVLTYTGILLARVPAPPPALRPGRTPESLRSSYYGLANAQKQTKTKPIITSYNAQ
ncbi:hypothetical protein PoB_003739200 [Plakobranchus ocellatus]|uniref:Uncharacterized protein n=1 Tax=Plakobranchus ocellatus TaxID=259542 RepID=A0AAV4AV51_9GAST|nr:hypothetical protein PoB_003739200 [Plakobranchus ocellatus]